MSNQYKRRVSNAIDSFYRREQKKENRTKRKNDSPEARAAKEVLSALRTMGFSVQIYESKAVFDDKRGVWACKSMQPGQPDIMGVSSEGVGVFVEMKAPGKLSTFWRETNTAQQDFILDRINMNCFSIVTDSVSHMMKLYSGWKNAVDKRQFLMDSLPKRPKRLRDDKPLFEE